MKRVQFCDKVQIYQPTETFTLLKTGPLLDKSYSYSGVNRLDKIVKQYEIDYSHATNFQDMRKANATFIKAIDCLPGRKTITERLVKRIIQIVDKS